MNSLNIDASQIDSAINQIHHFNMSSMPDLNSYIKAVNSMKYITDVINKLRGLDLKFSEETQARSIIRAYVSACKNNKKLIGLNETAREYLED